MSERRCGGDCCRAFPLNLSPAYIGERYAENKRLEAAGEDFDRDLVQIAEMVIELPGERDETPLYTCRNFDDATSLCLAYERRPKMCRDFPTYSPESRPCEYCGFSESLGCLPESAKDQRHQLASGTPAETRDEGD